MLKLFEFIVKSLLFITVIFAIIVIAETCSKRMDYDDPEKNRMMIFKYKIIHCDGREKIIIQDRPELNPPTPKNIRAYSSSGYIPVWEDYYNVCDIEILEKSYKQID